MHERRDARFAIRAPHKGAWAHGIKPNTRAVLSLPAHPSLALNLPQPQRFTGIATKWNIKGGYGFIKRPDGLPDIFVHQRSLHRSGFRSLREGEVVEFETKAAAGRLEAVAVTGPDGKEVLGVESKGSKTAGDGSSDESNSEAEEDARSERKTGGGERAKQAKVERPKPYTAFVPRNVKRPPPKKAGASSKAATVIQHPALGTVAADQ
mmetsp:Transcript_26216/g.61238  ORF Transcript_26216/g.61238 Transcript_26216/m.61238 type:complete len:208 (-) Transcript_26216:278-901(-)